MSFDIVQKLRCILKGNPIAQLAADEIARLRGELQVSVEQLAAAQADIHCYRIDTQAFRQAAKEMGMDVSDIAPSPSIARVLITKYAAAQAREAKLREAIGLAHDDSLDGRHAACRAELVEALTIPHDDTALRERLRAERERCAEVADSMTYGPCGEYDYHYGDAEQKADDRASNIAQDIRAMED